MLSGWLLMSWITQKSINQPQLYLINNPRMFNGAIVDLAEKPFIPQIFSLQWICCKCHAGCYRHTYFWPPLRLLEAKHHTATAHFGTFTQCWSIPQCQSVRSPYGVWPITASMEVKNVHQKKRSTNLINNRRMFNGATDDLAEKPYIPHKSLLQWICCKCLAW